MLRSRTITRQVKGATSAHHQMAGATLTAHRLPATPPMPFRQPAHGPSPVARRRVRECEPANRSATLAVCGFYGVHVAQACCLCAPRAPHLRLVEDDADVDARAPRTGRLPRSAPMIGHVAGTAGRSTLSPRKRGCAVRPGSFASAGCDRARRCSSSATRSLHFTAEKSSRCRSIRTATRQRGHRPSKGHCARMGNGIAWAQRDNEKRWTSPSERAPASSVAQRARSGRCDRRIAKSTRPARGRRRLGNAPRRLAPANLAGRSRGLPDRKRPKRNSINHAVATAPLLTKSIIYDTYTVSEISGAVSRQSSRNLRSKPMTKPRIKELTNARGKIL